MKLVHKNTENEEIWFYVEWRVCGRNDVIVCLRHVRADTPNIFLPFFIQSKGCQWFSCHVEGFVLILWSAIVKSWAPPYYSAIARTWRVKIAMADRGHLHKDDRLFFVSFGKTRDCVHLQKLYFDNINKYEDASLINNLYYSLDFSYKWEM